MGKSGEAKPSDHASRTDKRLSTLTRAAGYRAICTDWFSPGHTVGVYTKVWQAHHVACDHALGGRQIKDADREYVEQCLWITDWDLNNPDNLVGLPQKKHYKNTFDDPEVYAWLGVPVNYPAHNIGHNRMTGNYTDECKMWLKRNVWDKIVEEKKDHGAGAKAIQQGLEACTRVFKAKLTARGLRSAGTFLAWNGRFDPANAKTWFKPFSMEKTPRARFPGVPGKTKEKLFKLIPIK